jgi:hypothetical protein
MKLDLPLSITNAHNPKCAVWVFEVLSLFYVNVWTLCWFMDLTVHSGRYDD